MLFVRWDNPQLDRIILNPVREEHAGEHDVNTREPLVITLQCVCKSRLYPPGTYRCDVLDADFRRLKTVYWGVRVLPKGILNLDYDHAQSVWDSPWLWKKHIMSSILDSPILWVYIVSPTSATDGLGS